MTYEEWYKSDPWLSREGSALGAGSDYSAKTAWNQQQKEIDRLEEQLGKAECKETGLGYYADKNNWSRQYDTQNCTLLDEDDWSDAENMFAHGLKKGQTHSGKRAREYFENKGKN